MLVTQQILEHGVAAGILSVIAILRQSAPQRGEYTNQKALARPPVLLRLKNSGQRTIVPGLAREKEDYPRRRRSIGETP